MAVEFKYFKNKYFERIQNNYFKPILDDVFKMCGNSFKTVGDIGCGNGIFTAYLKENFDIRLIGVDASEYALGESKKRGFDEVYVCEDFSECPLPIESRYFDLAINKDVLPHMMDPENLIREISRVVKPQGYFLLHVANDFNLWKRLQFLFIWNIDTYGYCPGAKEWNQPHVRFFTFEGIKELLASHGFDVVKNYSSFFAHIGRLRYIPGFSQLLRWLADKNPTQFSQGYTVLARKREVA